MRTYVYIDGFNLYYGALKSTEYKWLNPFDLAQKILPGLTINKIKYFTARVSGKIDPGAPARQQTYIKALETLPNVEVVFGNFLSKTMRRPLANLPVAGGEVDFPPSLIFPQGKHDVVIQTRTKTLPIGFKQPTKHGKKTPNPPKNPLMAEVHSMEEKGSDVNIASHLLNDAWKDCFDVAAVISNDTDLVTPIDMVVRQREKTVYIISPKEGRTAPELKKVASNVRHLRPKFLKQSQFPDSVQRAAAGALHRPKEW